MRPSSVVIKASVTLVVAIAVGACTASATSPSPSPTTPGVSTGVPVPSPTAVLDSPAPSTAAAPSASASIPVAAKVDARVTVGPAVSPRWFAADDTSLWVHEPTSLVRVDLTTSAVSGQVAVGPMEYGYAAAGAGSVWQTDYENDAVLRIDPVSGKVTKSIPVGLQPLGVAVTAGSVWVADEHSEAVTRIDPKTNKVVATITLGTPGPAGPQILTAGPGGVWVSVPNMAEVVRIDAATNRVGLTVPLDGAVASDGTEVWICLNPGTDGPTKLVRIDPDSGAIITAVDLAGYGDLAVGLGSVWVNGGPGLLRIDEATGRIVGGVDLNGDYGNVIVAGGAVWVTAEGQPYVVRVTPQ